VSADCSDAVAALIGLPYASRFEGEAAMRLEWAAWTERSRPGVRRPATSCSLEILETPKGLQVDWQPFVEAINRSPRATPEDAGIWALAWHDALAEAALRVAHSSDNRAVVLSGGCFQNRLLTEVTVRPVTGWRLPSPLAPTRGHPTTGASPVGQVIGARRRLDRSPR
jgi:hydrogenase maturation protein HypF